MTKPKILVVEDEAITADHLRRLLSRLGYDVVGVVGSGARGIELLEQTQPDLLLADIGLEDPIDGIAVATQAREVWGIPTVYLTAYGDAETMRRARITEPYGYLLKPFAEQELHATIEIALQQKIARSRQEQKEKAAAQLLVRTEDQLRAVTERLFSTQEGERKAIARDLHDDIGQKIALLQIEFEEACQKLPPGVQQRADFGKILTLIGELADSVREVSHRLHPSILEDLGLVAALRQLAETFHDRHGIPTRFSARKAPENLQPEVAVALYRIAQEALRNVAQHAGPAEVNIALVGGPDKVNLSIRDNGVGFDPESPSQRIGLGLISIVERVEAAGGEVTIQSRPQEGTRIQVKVPLGGRRYGQDGPTGLAG